MEAARIVLGLLGLMLLGFAVSWVTAEAIQVAATRGL